MAPLATITSEIVPTHRERGAVEAWFFHGQPRSEWPDWVHSHFLSGTMPKPRKGRWAVRDDEGYFWRWLDSDKFTELYEPIPHAVQDEKCLLDRVEAVCKLWDEDHIEAYDAMAAIEAVLDGSDKP